MHHMGYISAQVFMTCLFCALLTVIVGRNLTPVSVAAAVVETRCGWFINPTPANAWLTDRDAEWIIGEQGGYQAEGDWPHFKPGQQAKVNGPYSYGCTCMRVTVNRTEKKVIQIFSSSSQPLSVCRKDKTLKGKEPEGLKEH
jgi:hypothetical protein